MRNRRAAALLEALVAAVLMAIVASTGTVLLRAQTRIANEMTGRSERNDATRSALLTLRAELAAVEPRADLRAVARDSIAVRIFRGVATVCGHHNRLTLVRYRGLRLPDLTKDSVLQIGVENVTSLIAVANAGAACVAARGEEILALELQVAAPRGSTWLIFESGAYHLSSHALRYRRTGETRQPITNEVIDVRRSSFMRVGDTVLHAVHVTLQDRRTSAIARTVIRLPNAP